MTNIVITNPTYTCSICGRSVLRENVEQHRCQQLANVAMEVVRMVEENTTKFCPFCGWSTIESKHENWCLYHKAKSALNCPEHLQ